MNVVGGALIGLAASMLFLFAGRVAGVSGLMRNLFGAAPSDHAWRAGFLIGLIATGAIGMILMPSAFEDAKQTSVAAIAVAGALIGFGTRLRRRLHVTG